MTPTREQVTAWVAQADAYASSQTSDFQEHGEIAAERFATLAMAAGRDQGLLEAKEVCEGIVKDNEYAYADECPGAIKQLRGK